MAQLSPGHRALALASRALDGMAPDLTARIMLRQFTRPRRKPGSDYRSRLPDGAQRLVLRHGQLELTAWRWGKSGPGVLLVHGWEDHSGSMLSFVGPLVALGYRVYALDAPGHGLSPGTATHLLDYSVALAQMARTYGPFDSIVAHSFGATAVGVKLTQEPGLRPSRMALIAPMRDMEQHLEVFADIALLSPNRTARLRRLVTDLVGTPLTGISTLQGLSDEIPGVVIHDRHDPVIPHAIGAAIAAQWRGATLFSTERLGHRRLLKCPRVQAEVLRLHGAGARTC